MGLFEVCHHAVFVIKVTLLKFLFVGFLIEKKIIISQVNQVYLAWISTLYQVRLALMNFHKYKDKNYMVIYVVISCVLNILILYILPQKISEEKQFICHSIKIIPTYSLVVVNKPALDVLENLNIRQWKKQETSWLFLIVYTLAVRCIKSIQSICALTKYHVGLSYIVPTATVRVLTKIWGSFLSEVQWMYRRWSPCDKISNLIRKVHKKGKKVWFLVEKVRKTKSKNWTQCLTDSVQGLASQKLQHSVIVLSTENSYFGIQSVHS